MPAVVQTGAKSSDPGKDKMELPKETFVELEADIRLAINMIAAHVYCVDGSDRPFDIPGFEIVSQKEAMELLGVSKKDIKPGVSGMQYEFEKDLYKEFERLYGAEVKAYEEEQKKQGKDDDKGGEKAGKNDDKDGSIIGDEPGKGKKKSFLETMKDIKSVKDIKSDRNKETKVQIADKREFISFCESSEMKDKDKGRDVVISGGGLLGGDGFKAAIYKRTGKFKLMKTPNLNPHFSGFNMDKVKYVLAFAGTDFSSIWSDWVKTNLAQAIPYYGVYPLQYRLAVLTALKLVKSIKGHESEWLITGHSLGGGLASAASIVSGLHAVTFNPAGLNTVNLANYLYELNLRSDVTLAEAIEFMNYKNLQLSCRSDVNKKYLKVIEKKDIKKNVCIYRSTTDILTSTQDDIKGSKTNLRELPQNLLAAVNEDLAAAYDKFMNEILPTINNAIDYAKQLYNDLMELYNQAKQIVDDIMKMKQELISMAIDLYNQALATYEDLKKEIEKIAEEPKKLYQQIQDLVERIKEIPGELKDEVMGLVDEIKTMVNGAVETTRQMLKEPMDKIMGVIDDIKGLKDLPSKLLSPSGLLEQIGNLLPDEIKNIPNVIKETAQQLLPGVEETLNVLKDGVKSLTGGLSDIGGQLMDAVGGLKDTATGIVNSITQTATGAFNELTGQVSQAANSLKQGVTSLVNNVSDSVGKAAGAIKDGVTSAFNEVSSGLSGAMNDVTSGLSSAFGDVTSGLS